MFAGFITNKILDSIAIGIEEVLSSRPETSQNYMKIFSIYVEMLQNIMFYSIDRIEIESGGDAAFGGFEIALDGDKVAITAVNPIDEKQHKKLANIMDEISASSPEEIVALYKKRMMEGFDDDESRGGGLGYYDIARRSSHPITHAFIANEGEQMLFKITAWV